VSLAERLAPGPVVLREIPLRIDPAEVRAFQGYKGVPATAEVVLEAAIAEVAAVIRPRGAYRALGVLEAEPDGLMLAGGVRLHIPGIGRHWGAVEAAAAAVVTVGGEVEALAQTRRRAGDAPGGVLLDSAASAAVECLAEWANDHLCRLGVASGLRVTNRISPGVAGWDLGDQPAVVRLCPAGEIGVRLDAGGRLGPAKSISFLVGIGRAARADHYFVQCRRCWADACAWRRMPAVARVHRDPAPRD